MTSVQLKERIAKATEKVTKKEATIIKKEAGIAKKQIILDKTTDERDRYWVECDIRYLQQDIKRLHKEIEETRSTIAKYEKQLAGEMEKEAAWATEIPEQFKDLQTALVDNWDEFDKKQRQFYREKYEELGYRAFFQKYSGAAYDLMHSSDEDIHKGNLKQSELLIIDLYNRVKDVTGEVTDWSNIRAEQGNIFPVLTGIVIGKQGRAKIETVLAGGYNIQRLHIRTLVHEI